MDSRSGQLDL
uniref:Uncharacterized protein n=1 Tax=Arundo donax TaxID=35708 RepID=A0A0A9FT19_ARUDO